MADDSVMEALGILAQTAASVYSTHEEAEFRSNQSELDRKHENNKLFLTNSLNLLSGAIDQKNQWKRDATLLGLTDQELTDVPDVSTSSGSKNVIQSQLGTTISNLNQTNAEINSIANDVGNYYKGINLGRSIDTNMSGKISTSTDSGGAGTSELEIWAKTDEGKEYADLLEKSPSFVLGLQNYTLDPKTLTGLQMDQELLKEQKVKNLFLPYKKENELLDIKIKTGNQELKNLAAEKEEIAARVSNIKTQTSLNAMELNRQKVAYDDDQWTYDQKVRNDAKTELNEFKTLNQQSQGEIGAGILSNILLPLDDNEYVAFMAVLGQEAGTDLTGNDEDLQKILEGTQFSEIAADINILINAYTMDKSDPSVADWSSTLSVLKKIRETKDVFDQYVPTSDVYRKMVEKNDFGDSMMSKFVEEIEGRVDGPTAKMIVQAIQWEQTQIFKPKTLELFEDLFKVESQAYDINAMLEQIHLIETDYSQQTHSQVQKKSKVNTALNILTVYPPNIPD